MVYNDKRKDKFNSPKTWSKLKVTGEGHRGQITIENDYFLAISSLTQKAIDRFIWALAGWCRMIKRKAKFYSQKKMVKGQGQRGQITYNVTFYAVSSMTQKVID